MIPFDRRSFLSSVFAAAGASLVPDWLWQAMAPQEPVSKWRREQLLTAARQAKAEGKPLLVFVVPPPSGESVGYLRAMWLGAWLTQAAPATLHNVGLCRLACGSVDEVQAVLGVELTDSHLLVAIDCARFGDAEPVVPRATPLSLELGSPYVVPGGRGGYDEENKAKAKAHIEAGFRLLDAELQNLLNRHGATLASVGAATMALLPEADKAALRAWFVGGAAPAEELIVRAAAEVRREATTLEGEARQRLLGGLTAAVTATVVKRPIAGARWQLPEGCGERFETPTPQEKKMGLALACGMGFVPPLCERFLHFYSAGQ